jgi:hypothetical protein
MHWTYAKRQLARLATVHQDGDDEGARILSQEPEESEAETHGCEPDVRFIQ